MSPLVTVTVTVQHDKEELQEEAHGALVPQGPPAQRQPGAAEGHPQE